MGPVMLKIWGIANWLVILGALVFALVGCASPQSVRGVTCAESRALICMNTNKPAPPLYGCKPTRAYPIKPEGMEVCL